jgi:hypothetical protein
MGFFHFVLYTACMISASTQSRFFLLLTDSKHVFIFVGSHYTGSKVSSGTTWSAMRVLAL